MADCLSLKDLSSSFADRTAFENSVAISLFTFSGTDLSAISLPTLDPRAAIHRRSAVEHRADVGTVQCRRQQTDRAHRDVAKYFSQMSFVSSDGLTPMADNTHFDSKSLRVFGERYAEAYLEASVVAKKFKSTARRTSGRSAKGRKIED